MPRRSRMLSLALTVTLATGCAATADVDQPVATSSSDAPREVAAAEVRVTTVHNDAVAVASQQVGAASDVASIASDSRFVAASGPTQATVIDAGAWTEPHGDHDHYFAGSPRIVGSLTMQSGDITMQSAQGMTVIRSSAGEVVVLNREALEAGQIEVSQSFPVAQGEGTAIAALGALVAVDADGARVLDGPALPLPPDCHGVGARLTSAGLFIACTTSLHLVTHDERIDWPTPQPIESLHGRGERALVTVVSAGSAWAFDIDQATFTPLVSHEHLAGALAIDNTAGHTVAVTAAGNVVLATGESTTALHSLETTAGLAITASRSLAFITTNDGYLEIDLTAGSSQWHAEPGLHAVTGL